MKLMFRLVDLILVFVLQFVQIDAQETSNSKLTIFTGMGELSWEFFNSTKPQLIKLFDAFGDVVNQIKEISPETVIVGRIYISDQPMNGDPQEAAEIWWSQVNTTILANPLVDYWEGYNEVVGGGNDQNTYDQMVWYAQMETYRMEIMSQYNVKACIGNFATGCPDIENSTIIKAWYPAMQAGQKYNAILGLHEYSSPWLTTCFDNTTQTGWLTGRYRKLYQQYFIPDNLVLPLVMTEMGIDGEVGCNDTPYDGGWQNFESYWTQNGGNPDGGVEYTHQLAWYDNLMLEDNYCMGATIFCLEIPGWDSWQLNEDAVNNLIQYMNGTPYKKYLQKS